MVTSKEGNFFQLSDTDKQQLAEAWHVLTARYCSDESLRTKRWIDLMRHYEARGRHYHNGTHLVALLRWCARYESALQRPEVVRLAIWFHDVIYRARRKDNETRSAAYAAETLAQLHLPPPLIVDAQSLIVATQRHQNATFTEALLHDGNWFLDFDLAILGSRPEIYAAYARAIRREYRWVPGLLFRQGRRQVLHSFQQRPQLYFTETMRAELETPARQNLAAELAALA